MRRVRSIPIMMVMAALLLGSVSAAPAQDSGGDCRYFAAAGHYVCGEFLEFYDARGALEVFGYPLTEAFEDPGRELRVQYFQCARMELHPNNPALYKTQLGLLVDELGYSFSPADPQQIPASNNNLHHYFPETGHVVSYAFLDYFREKGGLDIFGYPRSEFMYEDGYIVQYFQRARMEWHPESHSGPQMRLTNLGERYIESFGVPEDAARARPRGQASIEDVSKDASRARPTRLDTSASVRSVITGRAGVQTLFVYVTDQQQRPIQGASVKAVVRYPAGDRSYELTPTGAGGFASHSFEISPSPPGRRVVIDVSVTYYDNVTDTTLTGTTQAFFIPWW